MTGTLLSCQVETIQTRKDHTLKIVLGTPELTPAKGAEVLAMMNKVVATYFSPKDTIDQKEIDQVDNLQSEFGGKTPSQRLRNVLFVSYEQNKEGFKDFASFYTHKMETIIDHYKGKLA